MISHAQHTSGWLINADKNDVADGGEQNREFKLVEKTLDGKSFRLSLSQNVPKKVKIDNLNIIKQRLT